MRFPAASISRESQPGAAGVFGFSAGPFVLSHSDRENRPRAGGSLFVKSAGAIVKATCAALLLSGCIGEKHTFRYRLTLAVNAGGTTYSGSSVIEDTFIDQVALAGLAGGIPWSTRLRGDAVAIDLGSPGILFCVLARDRKRPTSRDAELLPILLFGNYFTEGFPSTNSGRFASQIREIARSKPKRVVDPIFLPMLVRFRDLNNPASVEHVDPANLAAQFGAGVELAGVTIEITDEPVTTSIENVLRWLKDGYPERWLVDPQRESLNQIPEERQLTYSAFERTGQ
jgi:hypothetical protein